MKKNIFKIKLISVMSVISILVGSVGVSAVQPIGVDEFLIKAGFPESLVTEMSEIQKEIIYNNSKNKVIKFAGHETKDFVLDDENNLSPVQARGGLISSSDLTISVLGTYTVDGKGSTLYHTVYPSFVWKKAVKVKNDSFSMAMYSGWEAIPGEENFRLHLLNSSGQSAQYVDLDPNQSHSAGYSYKVSSSTGASQALYSGYAYYNIEKKNSSASPRISLHYVHDKSPALNVSYGISIKFASISISGNINYLYEMSGNYEIVGLE